MAKSDKLNTNSDEMERLARVIWTLCRGYRRETVAVAMVNILASTCLNAAHGDKAKAEDFIRTIVDAAVAGMQGNGVSA